MLPSHGVDMLTSPFKCLNLQAKTSSSILHRQLTGGKLDLCHTAVYQPMKRGQMQHTEKRHKAH